MGLREQNLQISFAHSSLYSQTRPVFNSLHFAKYCVPCGEDFFPVATTTNASTERQVNNHYSQLGPW